uniref:Ricin B lectin domain-containing protein n=1 Tax=Helicotheca tamesis TaxID=374047 RepID=A0A7S2HG69_9STRA|eukprot:CAMPEP_0185737410 /NCGR_PEP_ID=MMETSP1171-20130828/30319_1 /TAXON_ID=374046 /ORGANISM="Helicotheca tamensis, Strain CCMP826" /LENGTH=264 /DNA_ID=CAMNT_0028408323 /DNA_START=42 /DNA_END=836 /DNA_ORIENTATION=+
MSSAIIFFLVALGQLSVVVASSDYFVLGDCGSSYAQRLLLRENWGNANFGPACVNHDNCYATCNADKGHCDRVFGSDLRGICDRSYKWWGHTVQRHACREVANTFESAVTRLGGDAYRAAQTEYCGSHIIQKTYNKALNLQSSEVYNGGSPGVWTPAHHNDQNWSIKFLSLTRVRVRHNTYGKCLNLQAHAAVNGGRPNVYDCADHTDQFWEIVDRGNGNYWIRNEGYGKCLNLQVHANRNNGRLSVWDCADHGDQYWTWVADF